jgi:hypothetical protein
VTKNLKMNNYKSTLTIVIGFLLLSNYFHSKPLLVISIAVGLIAIFSEKANDKIIWIWNKLTEVLGLIMPNVLLTIVFYLFLTPLAWLNRINRKRNPLQLRNETSSTFISKRKEFSKASLEKIW